MAGSQQWKRSILTDLKTGLDKPDHLKILKGEHGNVIKHSFVVISNISYFYAQHWTNNFINQKTYCFFDAFNPYFICPFIITIRY